MKKLEQLRSRLAALTAGSSSAAQDLAACRSLQERLRELKLEVLGQLAALRSEAYEKARRSPGPRPPDRELPERQAVAAKRLLQDVGQRVKGLLDDHGTAKLEKWSEIHREIDAHLGRLAQLEVRLARAAGEEVTGILRAPERPTAPDPDDELYAAVGAAVQQGQSPGTVCSHCGQTVDPGDRFCRRCGHRRP